jgi:hypothetical protein
MLDLATMKHSVALLPFLLAQMCLAQICNPEPHPQPNNGYSYLREEMKALHWIRTALVESQKIQPPSAPDDPERFRKLVQLHSTAEAVIDRYNCAAAILKNYKGSGNEYIKQSAETLVITIETTKDINEKLIGMMDSLYAAQKPEDIDQVGIAKMLGNVKSIQKDVMQLSMEATKMSTFGIFRMDKAGEDAKPVAFSVTREQRATLRAEAQDLAKNNGYSSYVDNCAKIILNDLARQF